MAHEPLIDDLSVVDNLALPVTMAGRHPDSDQVAVPLTVRTIYRTVVDKQNDRSAPASTSRQNRRYSLLEKLSRCGLSHSFQDLEQDRLGQDHRVVLLRKAPWRVLDEASRSGSSTFGSQTGSYTTTGDATPAQLQHALRCPVPART